MNKKQTARVQSFLPGGIPSKIRIYDNEGETADRFSCVFTGNYRSQTGGVFIHLFMSGAPYSPQGICQHGESHNQIDVQGNSWGGVSLGKSCHLGKRITFQTLPKDCQHVILHDYADLWDLPSEVIEPLLNILRPKRG
jgi:hypothetical protein